MIGLSYKQKCNNFGYHSSEVQSKGNDRRSLLSSMNFVIWMQTTFSSTFEVHMTKAVVSTVMFGALFARFPIVDYVTQL